MYLRKLMAITFADAHTAYGNFDYYGTGITLDDFL